MNQSNVSRHTRLGLYGSLCMLMFTFNAFAQKLSGKLGGNVEENNAVNDQLATIASYIEKGGYLLALVGIITGGALLINKQGQASTYAFIGSVVIAIAGKVVASLI